MNTLSFTELLSKSSASKSVSSVLQAVKNGNFPIDIEGSEGSFAAVLTAHLYNACAKQIFVVVPQEETADDLILDLAKSGIYSAKFPWWGAAPYRELSSMSAVFGERTKVLTDLSLGKKGVYIIPERAFLTPIPPPEYLKNLLVSLKQGGKIDVTSLSKTLVSFGYTRVPRAQVHGEFALRGEVLDIYMGGGVSGEEEAYRILFDFDNVETIKKFDPMMQSTSPVKIDKL
ncbi:MAG: transcription-repair coupling factor, partial [Treponema sp.]|nr:transcription-repair coupling factor [Treponema sp.]